MSLFELQTVKHIKFNGVNIDHVDLPCGMPRFNTNAQVAGFRSNDILGIVRPNNLSWLTVRTMARPVCHRDWLPRIEHLVDVFCAKHSDTDHNRPGPGMCNV